MAQRVASALRLPERSPVSRLMFCGIELLALLVLAGPGPLLAAAPTITTQPASQTIFYGDPVTFRVEAAGTAPLGYQWFRNGTAISSANTAAYTISMVSSNDHGAGFSVAVSNDSGSVTSAVAVLTVDFGIATPGPAYRVLDYGSVWRYDQTDDLDGIDWTAPNYDDSGWPSGPGLLAFENNPSIVPLINTYLDDPRNPPPGLIAGHAYYFRTTVTITNDSGAAPTTATVRCDDGAVIYLNGAPATWIRMPVGPDQNAVFATELPPSGDAIADEYYTNFAGVALQPGTNVIAVSVHQQNSGSSDIVWGMALDVAGYTRVRDTIAPTLTEMYPAAGSVVPSFTQLEVHFSEGVQGVKATDLLINGSGATSVKEYAPDAYIFDFPQPPTGQVQVAWSPFQTITDLSANSNRFAGGTYSFTLNPSVTAASVMITEFMASNQHTIRDEDGHYSDWIELYNAGDQPISLGRWSLTDDPARLTKWQFPVGVSILPQSYLLVWASGLDRTNPAAPLHTNFKLDKAANSYLGLVYSDGVTVVSAFPLYPQQYDDVSYGRDRMDQSLVGYFTRPTPRAANSTMGPGFGPEVHFSVASGTFQQPFTLTLSTSDTNAVIHYLLITNSTSAVVGNVPDASSPIYTGPIAISNTVQVRARAYPIQSGYFPGPARNETYLQLAATAANFSSDLPVVVFHNFGGGDVPLTADQFVTMQVFDTRNGRSSLLNPPDLAVQGYFHRRGQATLYNAKPNLRVETQDAFGSDLNVELLGMPAENDWVFYGIDAFDKVLMHNPLAHTLYREMGHYSSRTRYVEVYIKRVTSTVALPLAQADYAGLYVLEEKIKIDKNRVDIDRLQPENTDTNTITGGYLLSIDKADPGNPEYLGGTWVWYLDPDYYEITAPERAAQYAYINQYFNNFYNALISPNWTDPVLGYRAYIDMDSWIDYHLHNTFVFNVDMLRISTYFYKPRGGKIVQGPLWDFDRAFADSNDDRGYNPRRWRSGSSDGGTDPFNENCSIFCNPWYGKMFQDPDFWQQWIDRYQELRKTTYSLTNLYAHIDGFANQVREATRREYAKWSDTAPRAGTYSGDGFTYTFPNPGTWQGEVNFTKYWFSNRVDFMDSNFLNPPVFSSNGGAITSGFTLTITAPTRVANSTIYYTLDGTDPRLPGGAISPTAFSSVNTATLPLTSNARVFARNFNANHHNLTGPNNPPISSSWSGPTVGTFVVSTPPLIITEIMYNPGPPSAGTNGNDQFEFVELKNVGAQPVDLPGIRLKGLDFTFSSTNAITRLGPGEYAVLVRNLQAFQSRYPDVTNIAGQYNGKLDNAGEHLALEGPLGEPIEDVRYDNGWYPITDGPGFSLVVRNEYGSVDTYTNAASWRPSSAVGGSPGRADTAPAAFPPIVINEALTHTDLPQVDTVELYNPTADPVPIAGWFLTDDLSRPTKYRIPDTTIPAGGYVLFTEDQFNNNGTNSFALSSLGDAIYLFSGDGTNLTGYRHGFKFGAQRNGVTFGRYVTSDGIEHFATEQRNTLGSANAGPKVGPVVVNEIMYAPPPFGLDPDTVDEYVELRNITGQSAPLYDLEHPTNAWSLNGAVQFSFPPGTTLAPWSYALVVSFDPLQDPASLQWFRNKYALDPQTPLFGPFQGHLSNGGERLGLYMPDKPEIPPSPNAGFVPQVLVEEVHYSDLPPWPAGTAGTGNSLQRIASVAFADDPANWQAGAPSPGQLNPGSASVDTDGDGMPDEAELLAGTDPRNGQDFLRFDRVYFQGSDCVLEFTAHAGVTYAIEKLDDFGSGNGWTVLQDNISGREGPVTVTDPMAQNGRFYRLKVPGR